MGMSVDGENYPPLDEEQIIAMGEAANRVANKPFAFFQEMVNEWCNKKGWNDKDRPFGDTAALFHSEISEAYEEYRKGCRLNEHYYVADSNGIPKPEGIPVELADLVIRVLHFCEHEGIPLGWYIGLKMAYNETRSYRHGNKVQ